MDGVSQQEFDRVVVIDLIKEKGYKLVIELFGEGNLLLVSEGKIVNCLISKTWKSREVRPGADYQFPPARFNPRTQEFETFKKSFLLSNSDVVRTLATSINLGGQYAEEVCLRASVDKGTKASKLDEVSVERLYAGLRSIMEELPTAQATAVLEEGSAIDVTPIALHIHQDLGKQQFPSFQRRCKFFLEHRKVAEKVAQEIPRSRGWKGSYSNNGTLLRRAGRNRSGSLARRRRSTPLMAMWLTLSTSSRGMRRRPIGTS